MWQGFYGGLFLGGILMWMDGGCWVRMCRMKWIVRNWVCRDVARYVSTLRTPTQKYRTNLILCNLICRDVARYVSTPRTPTQHRRTKFILRNLICRDVARYVSTLRMPTQMQSHFIITVITPNKIYPASIAQDLFLI